MRFGLVTTVWLMVQPSVDKITKLIRRFPLQGGNLFLSDYRCSAGLKYPQTDVDLAHQIQSKEKAKLSNNGQ